MRRALVLIIALALCVPSSTLAQGPAAGRFERSPIQGSIDPQVLPIGLDDSATVTVMLELSGDPVAVAESKAPGRRLNGQQKGAIKANLKAHQDAITHDIAVRGGTIQSQVQSAYNGIRVGIARKELASLAGLPNVVAIHGLRPMTLNNANSVPYIGAPAVWQTYGFTGKGIKVAVIDSGIDYTHADFGGPGTAAAFQKADKADTRRADKKLFGPDAPKVKGGFDFSGDTYDASSDIPALTVPHPDPNPLDCDGHGSHTAGTAAGFGVTAAGATYHGPYNQSTHNNAFTVGPGVAPEADLYALRVFGCAGSTSLTVDAIDWAVDHDMDVINMSLGSALGRGDDPAAVASNNAAAAGVIVVASAGNEGPSPYIGGSPATATGAISVAALDTIASTPGAALSLSTGQTINGQNSNSAALLRSSVPIVVLRDAGGNVSLGCDPQEYVNSNVAGKLVVTQRGTCARAARAIYGQQAGAAAVAMINSDAGYPPFEGPITSNPDTGQPFNVTIPFLGVRGVIGASATDDPEKLLAADGGSTTMAAIQIANPNYQHFASFSSGGPRNGDSALKPDITAPGVSIQSTLVGSGNQGTRISGTSMSAPHVAGVAALTRQAHPGWTAEEIKAAIVNTGSPAGVIEYRVSRAGTGLVQPIGSTSTQVVATGDPGTASLSFGYAELGANFSATRALTVHNHDGSAVTVTLSTETAGESAPASVALGSTSVTVPAGGAASVNVTLNAPAASVGNSDSFRQVAGNIVLDQGHARPKLRVPYYLVPRSLSSVATTLTSKLNTGKPRAVAQVTNRGGVIPGTADVYAWGLADSEESFSSPIDTRAVGVQSFDFGGGSQLVVLAVNGYDRWSNASVGDFEVYLDTNEDGTNDYAVVGADFGAVTTGTFDGRLGSFVFDLKTGKGSIFFLASAPTDSSTVLLPFLTDQTDLTAANPSFAYTATTFSVQGAEFDVVGSSAAYNAYTPAISQGQFVTVAPGATASVQLSINTAEFAKTRPKGLMIVSIDNAAGAKEAQLITVPTN
ncbi:MAG: S8 family serine peptidase [Chloroflexota bacterium]|nr:S8 family serine peptidase [Chloroflexota bacterium]